MLLGCFPPNQYHFILIIYSFYLRLCNATLSEITVIIFTGMGHMCGGCASISIWHACVSIYVFPVYMRAHVYVGDIY